MLTNHILTQTDKHNSTSSRPNTTTYEQLIKVHMQQTELP